MGSPWQPLLQWWFGTAGTPSEVAQAKGTLWFGKSPANDLEAREHFADQMQQALAGGLEPWLAEPEGWLAVILLLDQLPRMIHRDSAQAYAGDLRAQALVREGLQQGRDQLLSPLQRTFVYLVLEHSEDLAEQNQAIACFASLLAQVPASELGYFQQSLDYAERHQRIIARFGRFAHRNALLERPSTEQELEFLKTPGSSF